MKLKVLIKKLLILYLSDKEDSEVIVYDVKSKKEFNVKGFYLMPNDEVVIEVLEKSADK